MAEFPRRLIETDSVLRCRKCQHAVYRVYRRQLLDRGGTPGQVYESVLWPAHPAVGPPVIPERPECPDCGGALSREAP